MEQDGTDLRRVPRDRPAIGVTMGDAAGIGPEIVLKALSDPVLAARSRNIVIGDVALLAKVVALLSLPLKLVSFDPNKPRGDSELEVLDLSNIPADLEIGRESPEAGRASAQYIERAVQLWRDGLIHAVATAPINKSSLALGGYNFPGHTEFLAQLTGTSEFAMSFFAEKLRVVLLSTHLSLRSAIELVKADRLVRLIEFTDKNLSKLLRRNVKIAVAGLNPHASEGGLFGTEEASEVVPAIEHCRKSGIDVSGPYSPDTIFLRGYKGEFDAVLACYHDQATIAVKSLAFGAAVNVTLGLPLIRTSVDHGTAFDIAGKGVADASSMKAAIKLAGELGSVQIAAAA